MSGSSKAKSSVRLDLRILWDIEMLGEDETDEEVNWRPGKDLGYNG